MDNLSLGLVILALFLVVQSFVILGLLRQASNQKGKTIQQLLIAAVGKDEKPESALRALVALNKPPQGKLKGIADEKKDKKPANTDYTIAIGT